MLLRTRDLALLLGFGVTKVGIQRARRWIDRARKAQAPKKHRRWTMQELKSLCPAIHMELVDRGEAE